MMRGDVMKATMSVEAASRGQNLSVVPPEKLDEFLDDFYGGLEREGLEFDREDNPLDTAITIVHGVGQITAALMGLDPDGVAVTIGSIEGNAPFGAYADHHAACVSLIEQERRVWIGIPLSQVIHTPPPAVALSIKNVHESITASGAVCGLCNITPVYEGGDNDLSGR
jgi:hypothetical protein